MENFQDHGDEGEIWFGKAVERRVIDWIKNNFKTTRNDSEPTILDLGCGNGHFTLKLMEAGWKNVAALDYSEKAVELAKKLVGFDSENDRIFKADILNPSTLPAKHYNAYDLIVDKGTFDAISLNPDFEGLEKISKTKVIADTFKNTLKTLLTAEDSLFIITSCNWTSQELEHIFGPEFKPVGEVTHTKFMFGGKSGQDVSTIIFKSIDT